MLQGLHWELQKNNRKPQKRKQLQSEWVVPLGSREHRLIVQQMVSQYNVQFKGSQPSGERLVEVLLIEENLTETIK
jgi:hypothetical protein